MGLTMREQAVEKARGIAEHFYVASDDITPDGVSDLDDATLYEFVQLFDYWWDEVEQRWRHVDE